MRTVRQMIADRVAVAVAGGRYNVRDDGNGASIFRDGELFFVVASVQGAVALADLLERADRLLDRRGSIASPATFQRRKIAVAIAMAMDFRLETDSDRKARLERERDTLLTDRIGTYDAGPARDRLMAIEVELAALRAPFTFAAGFA